MIVYDNSGMLDGNDVLGIITDKSNNPKTGNMAQLWILRKDQHPTDAIKNGSDSTVCGQCPHRGTSCYVNPMGYNAVYKAYQKGNYINRVIQYTTIRLGAYGDPCALPLYIIKRLINGVKTWTGYTHQWRTNKDFAPYVMASVDSEAEYYEANTAGWRTFRVKKANDPILPGEIMCPNTTHGVQCIKCGLCKGTSVKAKNICVDVHGKGKKHFV